MLNIAPLKTTSQASILSDIQQLIALDFARVDRLIVGQLESDVALITAICEHIVGSKGKRLRPILALLSAKLWGYEGDKHIKLAVAIEFIHTATLLHDDVVDESTLRRNQPTANAIWGNAASILVGDFLHSRAIQLITELNNIPILQKIGHHINIVAQGEVLQLVHRQNPKTSEAGYMEVIRRKTGVLFTAATEIAAMIAQATPLEQKAMAAYGLHLGMAFQITDDCLDYSASTAELGKNVGDDLAEGKVTLPLIYALERATVSEATLIRQTIQQGGLENLDAILQILKSTHALTYPHQAAEYQADLARQAIQDLPDNAYKTALLALTRLAVDRKY